MNWSVICVGQQTDAYIPIINEYAITSITFYSSLMRNLYKSLMHCPLSLCYSHTGLLTRKICDNTLLLNAIDK